MSGTQLFHKRISPLLLPHPRRNVTCFSLTVLFFEKKSRQKKLQLSGSLCRVLCLPCVRGGGPRSGGRDLRVCKARLQASPRRVRKPRSGWRVVKNNPSPPSAELPLHKGAVKRSFSINRGSAAPFLFDFLSYLLSPRSGLRISNQKKIYLYKGSKHYVHKSASGNSARRAE